MKEDMIGKDGQPICYDCIHRIVTERGEGCEHPYLYRKDGTLIEKRNDTICSNIYKNKCNKKEVKKV